MSEGLGGSVVQVCDSGTMADLLFFIPIKIFIVIQLYISIQQADEIGKYAV